MLYRNKRTGHVIETYGEIHSPDYEPVKTVEKKAPAETRPPARQARKSK